MFKVGLVGLGFMGSSHLNNYAKLEENGVDVKLVAICDVDSKKLSNFTGVEGNIEIGGSNIDLTKFKLYDDMEKMIKEEELDCVDICLPSYLHAPMSIKAMELGVNVMCEKPMSISSDACTQMIDTAKKTNKVLMVGHCLRYWNAYEYAKEIIDSNKFGKCVSGYFFRGGATPIWSWENWLLKKEKSGGCLFDQHVHDVDTINWMFGMPKSVSTIGRTVVEGSGFDAVSTNYIYADGKVINSQDDWTINGNGFGFSMLFRLNFEKGAVVFEGGKLTVYPPEGESFVPELTDEDAYYKELRLFYELLKDPTQCDYISLLLSHRDTICLAEAEQKSAESCGTVVNI